MPNEIWEHCGCSWIQMEHLPPCGCGEHKVNLYRDVDVIHWRGEHWSALCAFKELLKSFTGAAIIKLVRQAAEKRFNIKVQRRYLEWVDIGTVDQQPPLEVTAEDIDVVLKEINHAN